jgi:hypothetical protein
MKYLSIYPDWHFRTFGGLNLGIRILFPRTIYRNDAQEIEDTYEALSVIIGFVFFSLRFDFKYNYKPLDRRIDEKMASLKDNE